jgi:nicotinamidase-related amidase
MASTRDLRLPDRLRADLQQYLQDLRQAYVDRGSGGRFGFGTKPALLVIDLGKGWTDPDLVLGSDLESVVENNRELLDAARRAQIPIFFTTVAYGPDDPAAPWDRKKPGVRTALAAGSEAIQLDPRLNRRPNEKLLVKKYASCFKGTDLMEMLHGLGVDTLIVTGCSTFHCVYATCRDAVSSFRVIVPREAVGDRCELLHMVGLWDIDNGLGDVVSVKDVLEYFLRQSAPRAAPAQSGRP